jgi:hypothetical protein
MLRRTITSEFRQCLIKEPLRIERHRYSAAEQIEGIDHHKMRECAERILREKMANRLNEFRHQRSVLN